MTAAHRLRYALMGLAVLLLAGGPAGAADSRANTARKAATTAVTGVKQNKMGGIAGPRATTVAPLSISECHALGGEVRITSVCKTGHACLRFDEDGVAHSACIKEIR